ncbi:MAG: lipopolysaccharide heptosyltransferase II [Nitrospirae bacterium]|nr:MAG: lipopolysaccharide heptosyltransferase II [Nitrospirota bacterium]
MTMPALRALRKASPGSKISILLKPSVSPLFEHDPVVDEVIPYTEEYRGVSGRLKLASLLRSRNFCRAFLFQNALDAAVITFLAGIPERIGYSRDGRRLLLSDAVPFDQQARDLHHIDYYLNLLAKAGVAAESSRPWITLQPEERVAARERLKGLKRPVIALNPGAAYGSSKRWPPERFAALADRVLQETGGSIVIFGGPSERSIADEIEGKILLPGADTAVHFHDDGRLLNLAGRTTVRELAALIAESDLLVTNDSGPMHIGYAVRTPLVAIFGSTSARHTGPVGKGNMVISSQVDCAPCLERTCRRGDLKCMDLISAEEVFAAVRKLLNRERAVFFDRDGTLCRDAHYLSRMEDFEIFPEIGALHALKEKGFKLIGVTNQSGIARGRVDENFVRTVNDIFLTRYGFDGFYYCPHHPDEHCSCRKPEPGMLLDARVDHHIDLKRSFVVGDKEVDMLLAQAVGATGIHVSTGQEDHAPSAGLTASGLAEVARVING